MKHSEERYMLKVYYKDGKEESASYKTIEEANKELTNLMNEEIVIRMELYEMLISCVRD